MTVLDPIQAALAAADEITAKSRAVAAARLDEALARSHRTAAERDTFTAHCHRALAADYANWLRGYLRAGGSITNTYDRPLGRGNDLADAPSDWLILRERPDHTPTLYGAQSLHVIIPAGTPYRPEGVPATFHGTCGHSTFYFLDGFRIVGDFVPLYTDVRALLETP